MNENGELCGHCHEKIKQQLKKNKYKKIITLTCLAMSIGVLGIFSALIHEDCAGTDRTAPVCVKRERIKVYGEDENR